MNVAKHTDEQLAELTILYLDAVKTARQLQYANNLYSSENNELKKRLKAFEMKLKSQEYECEVCDE